MDSDRSQTDTFALEVGRFIEAEGLMRPGEAVVVGVSGGADSVALLAVLTGLASEPGRGYRLTVAHLNHGLRSEAAADAEFVDRLASARGVPCVAERRDVAAEAARAGESVEQAARRVRYAFLAEVARRVGAACVAVGHHADDNVETVLYRIVRGTHLRGLAGMPAARQLAAGGPRLVRPLLGCRRGRIEAFCRRAGLQWRTDHTNADTRPRRNFIRHELLPLLRERLNPRADEAVLRLAEAAGEADRHLAAEAHREVPPADRPGAVDAGALSALPPLIRKYALRAALEDAGVPMRSVGAERLAELSALVEPGAAAAAVALPGGFVARRQGGVVRFEAGDADHGAEPAAAVRLRCPGETVLADGRRITCGVAAHDRAAFERHCRSRPAGVELLDAGQLRGPLRCRARRAGDAFVPLGSPGTQSVSDFLTNRKLPAGERNRVLCVCDDLGIVYLAPLRIDHRVRVTERTERVVRVAVSPAADG